jgi:hypothetical protein
MLCGSLREQVAKLETYCRDDIGRTATREALEQHGTVI